MTLVRQIDGAWAPITGVQTLERMVSTCTVTYHDGRQEELPCDPYPVVETLDIRRVEQLLIEGTWGAEKLAPYGLVLAVPFTAPDGKQAIGVASYIADNGTVAEVFEVVDIPAPTPDPTPAEKLAAAGLTVEDLRALLAGDA